MIGVFDSGLGGVLTATYIHEQLPAYDLLVFADEAYVPYGEKEMDWIRARTFICLQRMFDQGCSLVVLACNTASIAAIVDRQKTYPDKKVLSISIPGVEEITEQDYHHIGVLATKISVEQQLYPMMFAKHYPDYAITIEQVIGVGLVEAIETGDEARISQLIDIYTQQFTKKCEALILGCTHYPLIQQALQKKLPHDLPLIDPGALATKKLVDYVYRHPVLAQQCITCTGGGTVRMATTQLSEHFAHQCKDLRGHEQEIEIHTL